MKVQLLLLLVCCCLIGRASAQKYPGAGWERATPESQGMSTSKLEEAFRYAGGLLGTDSHCASVHRNGYLLMDGHWGFHDELSTHIVWSVSKAFTSTLIGIAERDGLLNTEDLAAKYIQEWRNLDNGAQNITIDMLLRHDSGRYYDPVTDFVISQFQRSQTDFAIGLRQRHDPGTHYQYNQMAIQTLERVLTLATNSSVPDITAKELFGPLQFASDAYWQQKSVVLPIPNDPIMYGGMWTSCHDLARFGTLWLHQGVWEGGHRVFTDEFYVKGTNLPPAPRPGRRYHWGGPPNYRANGMGDQLVVFNPEKQLIITRMGGPFGLVFSGSEFVNMVMDSFLDGDVGSWDYEKHKAENVMPLEEKQLIDFLQTNGFEEGENGEIVPVKGSKGWYQFLPNSE